KKHHWARAFYDCALEESLLFEDELPVTSLDRPISRQWMAVIAVRLMSGEASDRETSVSFERALEQIEDVEELTPYSYEIVTAYQRGLLTGYPDGTFRPEGFLTRAEAAAIIWKLS
ncbi:MAG: S-layer homology domain-containing protein, partial [Firmicutes bacterium]|nr:S-layer homology domain-containing protein [Bacillota bacterium]